jgi:hypothetical protein
VSKHVEIKAGACHEEVAAVLFRLAKDVGEIGNGSLVDARVTSGPGSTRVGLAVIMEVPAVPGNCYGKGGR